MGEECDQKAGSMTPLQKATEVNPLLMFLARGKSEGKFVPFSSQVKQVVFSPNGGALLQALAMASRVRVYASLAFLEAAAVGLNVDEIISFLLIASDNQILERVLEKVEGPGTPIAPGLKAAMKKSQPLRACAIGLLNRLIGKGYNAKAALEAAGPDRHLRVRARMGFAELHKVHTLAGSVAHLCSSDREILALDQLFRRLEHRTPSALPQQSALLKLENFSQLSRLLKKCLLCYRGAIPIPPVSHPRLEWVNSLPRLHAIGKVFRNCLNDSVVYPTSLVLGQSFIAVYTSEASFASATSPSSYVFHVTLSLEDGVMAFNLVDAKGIDNQEMPDADLAAALVDLGLLTGVIWRIGGEILMNELAIGRFDQVFD